MERLFPIEKRSEYLYTLDYPYDYFLPELLEAGAGSVYALGRFVQKHAGLAKRPKITLGGGGCTTFCAHDAAGQPLMGRNFDYRAAPCLVVRTAPQTGYRSVGITDLNMMLYAFRGPKESSEQRLFLAPYACMDGVNEKGLAIAVLELKARATRQKRGRVPLGTTAVIRAALDTCATVEETVKLFQQYDLRAALFCDYHYQVLDAAGNCAVLEYVGNELRVLRGQDYAMNFYLSADGPKCREMGRDRETWVRDALAVSGGRMETADAMALLGKCRLHYRHWMGHMVECLWSAVYHCGDASVTVCAGPAGGEPIRFLQREDR